MKPCVSVIIPVYDVEKYLPRCLDSVCNQTLQNIEILLIEDGSPDECAEICDSYAKKDQRIRVIHKENAGVSAARNDGIEIAKGEYISFVDSDDIIAYDMLELLYRNITMQQADLAFCLYKNIDCNTTTVDHNPNDIPVNVLDAKGAFDAFADYSKLIEVTVWNKLFRKDIIDELRFDTTKKTAEDFEFLMKYLLKCSKTVFVDVALYGYFVQREGAAQNFTGKGIPFYTTQYHNVQKISRMVIENRPEWQSDMVGLATANSTLSLANAIVRLKAFNCKEVKLVKADLKENLKDIMDSKLIFMKKIQVLVFLFNIRVYGLLLRMRAN